MGCWEEYCLVCGGPAISPDVVEELEYPEDRSEEEKEALRAALTGLEWLDRYVGVLGTEELIPLGPYNSVGGFDSDDEKPITAAYFYCKDMAYMGWDPEDNKDLTLACHEKCQKLLQTELGYTLRFQDVWPMLMAQTETSDVSLRWGTSRATSRASSLAFNSFRWTDYGGIGVYQDQTFEYGQAVTDGNAWMLQDPTINERNASRILEVWRPLVANGFKIPPQIPARICRPLVANGFKIPPQIPVRICRPRSTRVAKKNPPQSSTGNLENEFVHLGLRE